MSDNQAAVFHTSFSICVFFSFSNLSIYTWVVLYFKRNNHLPQNLFYFCDIIYCLVSSYDLNNMYFSNFICYLLYYHYHYHYSDVCMCMCVRMCVPACVLCSWARQRPRCRCWRATCGTYLFLYLMCVPQEGLRSSSVSQAPLPTMP